VLRLRLYLDTSVVSAYLDDRFPQRMQETLDFWDTLAGFEVSISELTQAEIRDTGDARRRVGLLDLIRGFSVIEVNDEMRALARRYLDRSVLPPSARDDALHVAIAVVSRQDILVSWNFRHLVNRRRRAMINEVNIAAGYPVIEIVAPPEA